MKVYVFFLFKSSEWKEASWIHHTLFMTVATFLSLNMLATIVSGFVTSNKIPVHFSGSEEQFQDSWVWIGLIVMVYYY